MNTLVLKLHFSFTPLNRLICLRVNILKLKSIVKSKSSVATPALRCFISHSPTAKVWLLYQGHDSGQKGLKMNDWLRTFPTASLKQDSVLQDHRLDGFGQSWWTLDRLEELASQILEDHVRCDSFGQQFVQLGPDLAQTLRALLVDDIASYLSDEALVVWLGHLCIGA